MTRRQWDALLPLIALFFFALGAVSAIGLLIWAAVETELLLNLVRQASWLLLLPLLLLMVTGWLINRWVQGYRFATQRLAEEIELIAGVNSAYRVSVKGPGAMPQLTKAINELAARFQHILADQQSKIERASAEFAAERNRLAALMAELTEGIIVCNLSGQILLYNPSAHQLLTPAADNRSDHFLGLGRSIFTLLDSSILHYVLERLHTHAPLDDHQPVRFVTTSKKGLLLRARIVPVLDSQQILTGFILTLEDITESTEQHQQRDAYLQSLTGAIRPALTNIRAAIETIEDYPGMSAARLRAFQTIIRDESSQLSDAMENVVATFSYSDHLPALQSEAIRSDELLVMLQQQLQDKSNTPVELDRNRKCWWLRVDTHALVQALYQSVDELRQKGVNQALRLQTELVARFVALDLCWTNSKPVRTALQAWQNDTKLGSYQRLATLIAQHGGELWYQTDEIRQISFIRLLLPSADAPSRPDLLQSNGRETFYDFNLLFQSLIDAPELNHRELTSLTYTIFDTETTGLNPSQGDEIVSISAIRIVNGRLLSEERFDQLVDPRRDIPRAATAIHHITDEMVQGQPPIEQVLPRFERFAEDTVLVAHNAAFDMRMFQVKEQKTGVIFTQPLLDTLLLSAWLHPNQESHTLEEIAKRFSIPISNRHTSLGDALLTAQIFLKFIPLLAKKGITTLQQARDAAQQTYYANIQY